MEQFAHRTVGLGVRAPQQAVLLPLDAPWPRVLGVITTLTGIWGGATFALIPTDGSRLSPMWWRLLKRHDPDTVVSAGGITLSDRLQTQILEGHAMAEPVGQAISRLGTSYQRTHVKHAAGSVADLHVIDLGSRHFSREKSR